MKVIISHIEPAIANSVSLQWDVTPDPGISGSYLFEVQRSGSPDGPFTTLTTLANTVNFTDYFDTEPDPTVNNWINQLSLNKEIYYRIRAIAPNGVEDTSQPINLDGISKNTVNDSLAGIGYTINDEQVFPTPNNKDSIKPATSVRIRQRLLRRKIMREQFILLRKLIGVDAAILKRKHFGTFCVTCRDPLTKAVFRYDCSTCFGTGWEGGFFDPIPALVYVREVGVTETLTDHGPSTQRTTRISMLAYPKVEHADIIVELHNNTRWYVERMDPTDLRGIMVHQKIIANELSHGSIEYTVKV